MNITQQISPNNELIINIEGEFDAIGCQATKAVWASLSEQANQPHIILDLTLVNFLDSSGVGAIVFLFKRLKANKLTMSIVGANGQPQELLELLRINQAIPISVLADAH